MTVAVDIRTGRELGPVVSWNAHVGHVDVLTGAGCMTFTAHDVRLIERPADKQGEVEPFDVDANWEERA